MSCWIAQISPVSCLRLRGFDVVEERVGVFEPELRRAGRQNGVAAANDQDDIATGLLFEEAAIADPRQSAVQGHHLMREGVERQFGSRGAGVMEAFPLCILLYFYCT
jgi:hypothetical protein